MVLAHILNRLKALLLSVLSVFRRALCIFQKRRRKPSGDVIMENVIIDGGKESKHEENLVSWNTWDEDPVAIQNHIDKYRDSLSKLRAASNQEISNSSSVATSIEPEKEPDYFSDMVPEIKTSPSMSLNFHASPNPKQYKVNFEVQENFSSTFLTTPGLGDMNDDDEETTTGWEADLDVKQMIRQQRAEERRKKAENVLPKKLNQQYF